MPIRPIDILTMPNRSQEASQIHQAENQKLAHAQEKLGVQFNSEVKHDSQKTVKTNKSEEEEFRYSDGKKNKNGYAPGQHKKKEKKEEGEKGNKIKQSSFDIKI